MKNKRHKQEAVKQGGFLTKHKRENKDGIETVSSVLVLRFAKEVFVDW
jgi:hypothetical protein